MKLQLGLTNLFTKQSVLHFIDTESQAENTTSVSPLHEEEGLNQSWHYLHLLAVGEKCTYRNSTGYSTRLAENSIRFNPNRISNRISNVNSNSVHRKALMSGCIYVWTILVLYNTVHTIHTYVQSCLYSDTFPRL